MKYIIAICLCLILLTACGKTEQPQIESTDPSVSQTDPVETTEAPKQETTPETTVDAQQDAKALAESCINKSVEDLFALIGEPKESDYAPSCNGGEGAEDGNLYYDGFIVYTLKEGNEETVVFVE